MEITPAQLDAIAKWMGWPEVYITKALKGRCHVGTGPIDQNNMTHAMLVLEAMGKWCGDEGRTIYTVDLSGDGEAWVCEITKHVKYDPSEPIISKSADTLAGAIFACAAQLVGRM